MVFAVSPANTFPNYVHPLAKNFADFLQLLLACGDVAALEQAWMWDKAQFETFLQDNPPTQEQQETLALVATKLKLMPMERPWHISKSFRHLLITAKSSTPKNITMLWTRTQNQLSRSEGLL